MDKIERGCAVTVILMIAGLIAYVSLLYITVDEAYHDEPIPLTQVWRPVAPKVTVPFATPTPALPCDEDPGCFVLQPRLQ